VREPAGPASWIVERLEFDYLGGRHEGFGSLSWSPERGFSLEAQLTRIPSLPPGGVGIGHVGLVPKQHWKTVRMRLGGGLRAARRRSEDEVFVRRMEDLDCRLADENEVISS
jgi:hypothetical protein